MSTSQTVATTRTTNGAGRIGRVGLKALQITLAANFLMAGALKLLGAEQMVEMFATIGLGQWFRFFTGGVEVVFAGLLVLSATRRLAAVALAVVMAAAFAVELLILSGNPWLPLVLLVLLAVVGYPGSRP